MKNKSLVDLRQKGKYLEWIIQEYDHFYEMLKGKNPFPLQVEIHPYHSSQKIPCTNSCVYCTGQAYRESFRGGNIKGIEPDKISKLIKDVKSKVKRIVISGNNTEPLIYPWIADVLRDVLENNLDLFLYTNFYKGNNEVREALIEGDTDSFVRISLDAGNSDSYDKVHNPIHKDCFKVVQKNVEDLITLRENRRSSLKVYTHYLLTEENSNKQELTNFVDWASDVGVDVVQFCVPQKPITIELNPNDYSAIMSEEAYNTVKNDLLEIKEQKDGYIRIALIEPLREQKLKPFFRCNVQGIVAVIGYNGLMFPCTSVASEKFKHMTYGDINKKDFFDIWNSGERLKKMNFSLGNCPDCTRAEFGINEELRNEIIF
ncbi:MAG: radical SAM/SPASM domain-containing protein [Nanoarchaeota archaeon]|nr:radical SAM/SPASM domain-containing protein [Nanoarchaeota archaeon]